MLAYMEHIEMLGTKDTDGLGFDVVICVQAPLVLAIWLTLATRHYGTSRPTDTIGHTNPG